VAQLERQKQGIGRFASTGVHDILERLPINIENWCKIRPSMWYFLCAIGSAFKTCHDAAGDEAGGKTKERRRSGKVNTVAHEVYGPNNQINNAADGSLGDGQGVLSQISALSSSSFTGPAAFQLGWDIVMAHLVPGYMQNKTIVLVFRAPPIGPVWMFWAGIRFGFALLFFSWGLHLI
jgi:hypothetical protein